MEIKSNVLNEKTKKMTTNVNVKVIELLEMLKNLNTSNTLYNNQTNIFTETYNYLSKNNNNKYISLNSFKFKYKPYCLYSSSRKGNKTVNCASFVEKLLGDLITCTGSSIVTNPSWCHQRRTVKSTPCIDPSKSKLTMKHIHSTNTPMSNSNA